MTQEVQVLYCDCCGREKLAEVRGDKLVITDRRHGKKHTLVIPLPIDSRMPVSTR